MCCDDQRKSDQTKRMTAAIRDVIDAHSQSHCMFMVEFPVTLGKQSPLRADILVVPMQARAWAETLVIEVDPPAHYCNADARSHVCNTSSIEGKRDVLLDADERKDERYAQMGMQHLRVTVGLAWDMDAFEQVARAVHKRMQAAGI